MNSARDLPDCFCAAVKECFGGACLYGFVGLRVSVQHTRYMRFLANNFAVEAYELSDPGAWHVIILLNICVVYAHPKTTHLVHSRKLVVQSIIS